MTPAINALDAAGVAYTTHEYHHDGSLRDFGIEAARALGLDPDRVFKTLVVSVADGGEAVVVVPVSCQVALKAAAAALGVKRVELCDRARAERLTGYVIGGISPIGQKRRLPTVIDETCVLYPTVFVSGGRRGLDLELAPDDLVALTGAVLADVTDV